MPIASRELQAGGPILLPCAAGGLPAAPANALISRGGSADGAAAARRARSRRDAARVGGGAAYARGPAHSHRTG